MKVLISLLVHECQRTIEDQLRNIAEFFEDPIVILHLSQSYTESTDFSQFPHVRVNPVRYKTKWGNISYLHYANIKYALEENIPFHYVVFCSSNELYFRKGVEAYLKTADAFMDPRGIIKDGKFQYKPPRNAFYAVTAVIDKAFTDKKLLQFVKKHNLPGICKSQIEGSAYSKPVVVRMMKVLEKDFGFPYMQSIGYCGEELLLPTVFLAVQGKANVKRQFSFNDWCHDFTPALTIRALNHWRGKKSKRMTRYFKEIGVHSNIYAVKGVKRTYFNRVRNYVRSLTPRVSLSFDQRMAYFRADVKYNMNILKKEIKPKRLLLKTVHWVLGCCSRLIGKPKSYLKWKLQKQALWLLKKTGLRVG